MSFSAAMQRRRYEHWNRYSAKFSPSLSRHMKDLQLNSLGL